MNKKLSLTVGIATCYGGESIIDTIKSIRASEKITKFKIILIADRVPLSEFVKKQLRKLKVEFYENLVESSQAKKRKQIIELTNTDLLILTQDDVLFSKTTLKKVISQFVKHPEITMLSILNKPVKATNFFESILNKGTDIVSKIAVNWDRGDNYLAVVGRFMAFRTNWVRKFDIRDSISTNDAYFYFQNRKLNGIYRYFPQAYVLFKNPQNMKEHLRKSSRFQLSKLEMEKYYGRLEKEYRIPTRIILSVLIEELFRDPIKMIFYIGVNIYTKIFRLDSKKILNVLWEIDSSTKKVTA